jgi:hypothetical protein
MKRLPGARRSCAVLEVARHLADLPERGYAAHRCLRSARAAGGQSGVRTTHSVHGGRDAHLVRPMIVGGRSTCDPGRGPNEGRARDHRKIHFQIGSTNRLSRGSHALAVGERVDASDEARARQSGRERRGRDNLCAHEAPAVHRWPDRPSRRARGSASQGTGSHAERGAPGTSLHTAAALPAPRRARPHAHSASRHLRGLHRRGRRVLADCRAGVIP